MQKNKTSVHIISKYCKINPTNSKTSKNFFNAEHFQFSFPYFKRLMTQNYLFLKT